MLFVSGSYQNHHNGTVSISIELTGVGRGGGSTEGQYLSGVTIDLLMCERGGAVYSVQTTV
jgi:hypothetical protein